MGRRGGGTVRNERGKLREVLETKEVIPEGKMSC